MLMCWGKGVVAWGREGGGGETAWPWPSSAYPPSASIVSHSLDNPRIAYNQNESTHDAVLNNTKTRWARLPVIRVRT